MRIGFTALPVFCLVLGACGEKEEAAGIPSAVEAGFKTGYKCEQHLLVTRVVYDLIGMIARTEGESPDFPDSISETGPRTYRLSGSPSIELTMEPSAWDLDTYEPLLSTLKARSQDPPGGSLLGDFLSPDITTLQSHNQDLSARLRTNPSSSHLHEQAALLLGTWGLREEAEWFTDLRPLLCRMTAHLAFARALRDGKAPSLDGKWAELLYDYHAGRRTRAHVALGKLKSADGPARAWSRAMAVFITGDWRPLKQESDLTLLEAIAQFRALRTHVSADRAVAMLEGREDLQKMPDWTRILLSRGASVEHGHICREAALPLELAEVNHIFPIKEGADFRKTHPEHLNDKSPVMLFDSTGNAAVIHDGDWAYYFRRHLLFNFYRLNRFMLRSWGVPEAAREWERQFSPFFRALNGYDQAAPLFATRSSDFAKRLKSVPEAIKSDPIGTTARLWTAYRWSINGFKGKVVMPDQNPWFRDAVPPKTAYNARNRTACDSLKGVPALEAMLALDPWNPDLAEVLVNESGKLSEKRVRKAYQAIEDYSVSALQKVRHTQQVKTDELLKTLQKMSFLDPEYALDHGKLLAARGEDEAAAKEFEHAFEECGDRVAVSNSTRWLIHYHRDKGNLARAQEIADHNAEVYSGRGLISALALALDLKDRERSKELAEALAERYDENDYRGLVSWVIDGREDTPVLKRIFPDGFRKVTLAEMEKGEVNKGLRIQNTSELIHIPNLDYRDIILAVDGIKVDTFPQYNFLMDSTLNPSVTFIVRRTRPKVSYYERTMILPHRRIDCNLKAVGQ